MNIISNAVEHTQCQSVALTARVEEKNSSLYALILVLDRPWNLLKKATQRSFIKRIKAEQSRNHSNMV